MNPAKIVETKFLHAVFADGRRTTRHAFLQPRLFKRDSPRATLLETPSLLILYGDKTAIDVRLKTVS